MQKKDTLLYGHIPVKQAVFKKALSSALPSIVDWALPVSRKSLDTDSPSTNW
jgi:hypothetical protein